MDLPQYVVNTNRMYMNLDDQLAEVITKMKAEIVKRVEQQTGLSVHELVAAGYRLRVHPTPDVQAYNYKFFGKKGAYANITVHFERPDPE